MAPPTDHAHTGVQVTEQQGQLKSCFQPEGYTLPIANTFGPTLHRHVLCLEVKIHIILHTVEPAYNGHPFSEGPLSEVPL